MSEQILAAIQSSLQSMPEFLSDSVVINDTNLLDGSFTYLPMVLITQSGLISGNYDSMDCPVRTWQVPIFIIIPLDTWETSISELANLRESVLTHFDILNNRSLGIDDHYVSLESIADINPNEPVLAYEDPVTTPEMDSETTPMLLDIGMIFTIEERFG